MVWLVLLAGCVTSPEVRVVSPEEVSGGEALVLDGERLRADLTVRLEAEGAEPIPLSVKHESRERVRAELPPRVRPGDWQVVVEQARGEPVGMWPITVVPPLEETACTDEFSANTEVSLVRSEIVIDRYYRSGEKEQLQLGLDDVVHVELERAEHDDGPCSAIYLRTTEGRRVVFADDRVVDLADRAIRVAKTMGVELVVLPAPDAAAMGDDVD